jgi:hypothetical protein
MGRKRKEMAEGSEELRARVKELALCGLTIRQIAEAAPTTYDKAKYHVCTLHRLQEIPGAATRRKLGDGDPEQRRVALARYGHGVRVGYIRDILVGLTPAQLDWLLAQTPKGGAVGDIIRAIIIDAYEEENDAS